MSDLTVNEIADLNRRIQKGYNEVFALCAGRFRTTSSGQPGRDWVMTIPVRDTDSDVVLCDALKAAEELLDRERQRIIP